MRYLFSILVILWTVASAALDAAGIWHIPLLAVILPAIIWFGLLAVLIIVVVVVGLTALIAAARSRKQFI